MVKWKEGKDFSSYKGYNGFKSLKKERRDGPFVHFRKKLKKPP